MAKSRVSGFVRRILPSLGPLAVGILLSAIIFTVLRGLEVKNAQESFNGYAHERLDALETNVTRTLTSLVSIGGLYDASGNVDRRQFSRFAASLRERNQAIQALEWIPRVPKRWRPRYEQWARRDGFVSFQFSERLSSLEMVRETEREEYYPVFFVEPLEGNERALGFDLASDSVRRQALERSADTGQLVATDRIKLVQETSAQYGFLVFRPVYDGGIEPTGIAGKRQALKGFALAVFRVADIVETAGSAPGTAADLNLAIFDLDAKPGERLLYPKGAHFDGVGDVPRGLTVTRTIPVAGRMWELAVYPGANGFGPVRWNSWAALLAGLLVTFFLTAHLAGRKHAGEALEASQERYRSLVCNVPEVVWTLDAGGCFSFISPNIERLSGFTAQEIYTQGSRLFFACLHPDDVDNVRTGIEALFAKGQPYDVEFRVRRKSGEWIWVHDLARTTYVRNGIRYADGLLSNITELKRVEQRLRVQYETARALAECNKLDDAAPAILQSLCQVLGWEHGVLWRVDREANVLRWVKCWHETSVELAELEAAQCQITFPPGAGLAGNVWSSGKPSWIPDITALDGYFGIAAGRGLRTAVTFPVVSGGVVLTVMQLFSREVVEPDEQVLQMLMGIAGQIGPLIARQRAEEALQQSDERARLLFDTIPQPAYVVDIATLNFLEVNDAAVKQYGYGRDEFLRMKVTDIRVAEDVERLMEYVEAAPSEGSAGLWKHLTKDGRTIDVEVNFHRLDYDGRKAYLAIAQDVTERNRLEIELRQAQKLEAVGSLASGIAHEINTPIQFIGDNTRFLREAYTDLNKVLEKYYRLKAVAGACEAGLGLAEEAAEAEAAVDLTYLMQEIPKAIEESLDGVTRVATIVAAMKEFAHPDLKERAAADINRALLSTLTVARNELKYVADMETDFADLPLVVCHIGDLNQVFLNLLVNAAHAIGDVVNGTGRRGVIKVRTALEPDAVVISVADTGHGIPENIRHKIFTPFFTTKESGRGTGQGLAIARSVVVNKHGGTLTFTSEVGKGTTFYVRLPLGDDEESRSGLSPTAVFQPEPVGGPVAQL